MKPRWGPDGINRREFLGGAGGMMLAAIAARSASGDSGTARRGFSDQTEQSTHTRPSGQHYPVKPRFNMKVPMRDGVKLSVDLYRPNAPGKFPTLLMLTYFDNANISKVRQALGFAEQGYAVALVDCRGRFDSDGTWEPYVNEPRDGYDIQEWLGKQPWSSGKIGTFGISYDGFTQLMPAPFHSPSLRCLVPMRCQQTNFGHLYNDGVMQINVVFMAGVFYNGRTMQPSLLQSLGSSPSAPQVINWDEVFRRLPLITAVDDIVDAPYIKEWIRHDRYDSYWKAYGIKEKYGDIQAPAYFISGWYDNLLHETWRNFQGFRHQGGSAEVRNGSKILVGPWTHGILDPNGHNWPIDLGTDTVVDFNTVHVRWYDYWLKGIQNGIDQEAPIRIFVMGANQWRSENEWPLARTKWTNYYLQSAGRANSLSGDGGLTLSAPGPSASPDKYTYDPRNPVPTLGGSISMPLYLQGPQDRRPIEKRDDVLVYTSAPLAYDTEVTGPVELRLHAASNAVDTDFTATLTDVYPDGRSIIICEGIRGARFRDSMENPGLIRPGKVYDYTVSLWETSNVFKAGHCIRLEVSSSNFPRYARNQNTGQPFGMSAEINPAAQTIFHDSQYPSRLILPIIPPV